MYLVVYHLGYAGLHNRNPSHHLKRAYPTISQACRARDRLFTRRAKGRWPVTEAYICHAVRDKRDRWKPFCRLELAVRMR